MHYRGHVDKNGKLEDDDSRLLYGYDVCCDFIEKNHTRCIRKNRE